MQFDTADLIDGILKDPAACVEDARLLLGRRRHTLCGIESNVIVQLRVYGAMQEVPPQLPLLRDLRDLIRAIHDFAELDAWPTVISTPPHRVESARSIVARCKIALARVQGLVQ